MVDYTSEYQVKLSYAIGYYKAIHNLNFASRKEYEDYFIQNGIMI